MAARLAASDECVRPNVLSHGMSNAAEEGLKLCEVGVPSFFDVLPRDPYGNARSDPSDCISKLYRLPISAESQCKRDGIGDSDSNR